MKLGCKLHALRLPSGKGRGRLPEGDVSEADIIDGLKLPSDLRNVFEELQGVFHRHLKDIGDVFILVFHFKGFTVIAFPVTNLTWDVYIRKEMHLDLDDSVTTACFTAAALHVEAETAFFISAYLRFIRGGEYVTDIIEDPCIGRRIRPGRTADRGLVDVDDLIEMLDPLDFLMKPRLRLGVMKLLGKGLMKDLVDKGTLT